MILRRHIFGDELRSIPIKFKKNKIKFQFLSILPKFSIPRENRLRTGTSSGKVGDAF